MRGRSQITSAGNTSRMATLSCVLSELDRVRVWKGSGSSLAQVWHGLGLGLVNLALYFYTFFCLDSLPFYS